MFNIIHFRKYQQRIPNELLCELSQCLLDETLYSIVKELTGIQNVTEKQLFQKRLEMINKHSGKFTNRIPCLTLF